MEAFPQIETNRLWLKKPTLQDIPKLVTYAGHPKIAETTLNIPHPYTEDDAIFWINSANQGFADRTQFTFGMYPKATGEFIGGVGLKINRRFNRAEMGYWVAEPFWNQGFATEAVGGILAFGFNTLALNKIYATHLLQNPASGQVMLKNGMIKEGELKDHCRKGETYQTLVQYRLTKIEFENI